MAAYVALLTVWLSDSPIVVASVISGVGILGGALALGVRHGVDWDHIAAITDITSANATDGDSANRWLQHEPGLMLSDESHHSLAQRIELPVMTTLPAMAMAGGVAVHMHDSLTAPPGGSFASLERMLRPHRPALLLGTMYALGHGTMVTVLGMIALIASGFLPEWIDPVMERIVGVTLIFLAGYLFYSIYRYFRGGGEFQLRSRWMLVFAGGRRLVHHVGDKLSREPRTHEHPEAFSQQYGARTAYGVGLVHGIGAETGTQVLIIATAVGAGSKIAGVGALLAFVAGLFISNSIVTVMTTFGFVSASGKQWIYVSVGMFAAVFSLFVGVIFLLQAGGSLPDLGAYFKWVGGPG
jgi:high-affinity nickel-transport protein